MILIVKKLYMRL